MAQGTKHKSQGTIVANRKIQENFKYSKMCNGIPTASTTSHKPSRPTHTHTHNPSDLE